jgi:L-malate glycosyltransferase
VCARLPGNRSLKVLLFFPSEIEALGGAELSVLSLAEGLAHRGHQTIVLEFAANRAKRRRLPSGTVVLSIPRAVCPEPGHPKSWVRFSRSVWQFRNVVREFKPDIVSVHFASWQSVPVVAANALPHSWRLVVTARGSDIGTIPFSQPRLSGWQSLLFEQADAVTAVSRSLLQDLLALYPLPQDNTHVIRNSLDSEWLERMPEARRVNVERYVLFVGAFRKVKGIDVLLRAWQRLQARTTGLSLWLVGAGEDFDTMIALSEELGVSGSVRFLGQRPQKELPALYRDAELAVIPSRNEGLPRVALEAGACGTICVGSNVGGLPEVIDDQVTGFLVNSESPEKLEEAISRVVSLSTELKHRMSTMARERIRQRFSYAEMLNSYEQLFFSLLEKPRRHKRAWSKL